MAAKKENKKVKNNIAEEISLDDLDLDILREAGITDDEINDFNNTKKTNKKEDLVKNETSPKQEKKTKNIDFDFEEKPRKKRNDDDFDDEEKEDID